MCWDRLSTVDGFPMVDRGNSLQLTALKKSSGHSMPSSSISTFFAIALLFYYLVDRFPTPTTWVPYRISNKCLQ
ncbi:hypothetical protein ASPWEDRAFT_192028 [Aspergillus wentii DTO 134E9]|uniref:Uncharacterized protein n=1 Tax=Aspergillus wentii DTO 134E9 TaxID=1073089 RepID=A0A1L9RYR8_ASPWE|nr:uncharacterized protein ASPWEDRAFT_192028 [Aspergillus wentii DTO 134E9]OJJ40091.1 hypothetical protein ASPWEDRAFT_192028 [Aspergillus wentii DTO 134E9]